MNIIFYANYLKSGVGAAPSPAPTITIYSVNRSTGAEALVASAAAMTASALTGRYYYQLTGADLNTYDYHARATTSDTTVDQRDQPALWTRFSEAIATDASGRITLDPTQTWTLPGGNTVTTLNVCQAAYLQGLGDWVFPGTTVTTTTETVKTGASTADGSGGTVQATFTILLDAGGSPIGRVKQ